MIHAEMFIYFVLMCLFIYKLGKFPKSENALKEEGMTPINKVKKAWAKKGKHKPQVNDDHAAWKKENSKD